jgi:outer membrane lipoprotein-sorting protein
MSISILFFLLLVAIVFSGCIHYSETFVVGSSAQQIQDKYGAFDVADYTEKDELYYGAYLVKETDEYGNPSVYYGITFENGVAVSVERTGPKGG